LSTDGALQKEGTLGKPACKIKEYALKAEMDLTTLTISFVTVPDKFA
jgi:hypothetical protein